jgi:hypothetical protein
MAPRPSKRMSANDTPQFPTAVRGELPVATNFSQEQAWQKKIHPDLHTEAVRRKDLFWPHNRVVPHISWPPTPLEPGSGILEIRLFADVFIRPIRTPDDNGREWTTSAALVSRTVLQPATRVVGSKYYGEDFPDERYFRTHYVWNIFWSPVRDCRVVISGVPNQDKFGFETLSGDAIWKSLPSGPHGIPFRLRRGAEDNPVVIKRGTPIARIEIVDYETEAPHDPAAGI